MKWFLTPSVTLFALAALAISLRIMVNKKHYDRASTEKHLVDSQVFYPSQPLLIGAGVNADWCPRVSLIKKDHTLETLIHGYVPK